MKSYGIDRRAIFKQGHRILCSGHVMFHQQSPYERRALDSMSELYCGLAQAVFGIHVLRAYQKY